MSMSTAIHWCDSTVNPTMGCDGCELWNEHRRSCYAGLLHTRFGGHTTGYAPSFGEVTLFPGRMARAARWPDLFHTARPRKPWLDGLPRMIFVSDMSDALSHSVAFAYLAAEIIHTAASPLGNRHVWLWLTKRPNRMAEFSRWLVEHRLAWPPNLWPGTTVTSTATLGRIGDLLQVGTHTTLHFLSVEPQIEPLDLTPWLPMLHWVIVGGESGRSARPFHLEWAYAIAEQCRVHHAPLFVKQLGTAAYQKGKRLRFVDSHASDWCEWPDSLRLREVPAMRATRCASSPESTR